VGIPHIVAIDPGVTGAIAVLAATGILSVVDLPTTMRFTGRPRIAGDQLLRLLAGATKGDIPTVIVTEKIHAMPVSGSVGIFSQGSVTGSIEAVLDILCEQRPWITTTYVSPYEWKNHFGLLKRDKEAARQKAIAIFGKSDLLARKKDHNRAEAGLIALYLAHQSAATLDGDAA
jgi:hypothetical protein